MRLRDYFDPRNPVGRIGWAIAALYMAFVGVPMAVMCGMGWCVR